MTPIYFALAANICFSIAILIFTSYSLKTSVIWTNTFKAIVAFIAFTLTVSIFMQWHPVQPLSVLALLVSGGMGLAIGDLFLLKAFTLIGPSRTMVLFGFQPLYMAACAYYLFGQPVPLERFLAVVFLIACLLTFSVERYKTSKDWGTRGILLAIVAVVLDGTGILLTRYAFDLSPDLHSFEGNAYRCAGAIFGLLVVGWMTKPIELGKHFFNMSGKTKALILIGSLMGTYLSLGFYLQAVKTGHLASISAIAITGPFFAAFFEYLYRREWPSRLFVLAFVLFAVGFYLLNW